MSLTVVAYHGTLCFCMTQRTAAAAAKACIPIPIGQMLSRQNRIALVFRNAFVSTHCTDAVISKVFRFWKMFVRKKITVVIYSKQETIIALSHIAYLRQRVVLFQQYLCLVKAYNIAVRSWFCCGII